MMSKSFLSRLSCLLVATLAVSCMDKPITAPEEDTSEPTLSSPTQTTAIPTPTTTLPAATLTPIPTLNPDAPTPDFMTSAIAPGYLLAPGPPGCELPCWQGLRVGVSTRQDVLDTFNAVFDFGGYLDVFDFESTDVGPFAQTITEIPKMEGGGFTWDTQEGDAGFDLIALVDSRTQILAGLYFNHTTRVGAENPPRYTVRTVQQLVAELGLPNSIYITRQNAWITGIRLVYREGLVSTSILEVRGQPGLPDTDPSRSSEICLNDIPKHAYDIIVTEFDNIEGGLVPSNPLNDEWVNESASAQGYTTSVEETLGLSVEEFVTIALSNDPCITVDYDSLPPTR